MLCMFSFSAVIVRMTTFRLNLTLCYCVGLKFYVCDFVVCIIYYFSIYLFIVIIVVCELMKCEVID